MGRFQRACEKEEKIIGKEVEILKE